MKYEKPPLTFEAQIQQLLERGLQGDLNLMVNRLKTVNYYRLTGYLYPYRASGNDNFIDGTHFDTIWEQYAFDRRLRLIVLDAIERIEIAVRTQLAYHHSHTYNDPFAYATLRTSLPNIDQDKYYMFLNKIISETKRASKDEFVKHFFETYGDQHGFLPTWMAIEIMSFGTMQLFFRGSPISIQRKVASYFDMPAKVMDSWLHTLSIVRNICAHHGRLWNKVLGVKPFIPRKKEYPDWHTPVLITNNQIFGILTICRYCLRIIAPQSRWRECFKGLLHDFPGINLQQMGFPQNWEQSPIWQPLPLPSALVH